MKQLVDQRFFFHRSLPLEFFYFDYFYYACGGHAVYYLGVYGYGADITNESQRAARWDEYMAF